MKWNNAASSQQVAKQLICEGGMYNGIKVEMGIYWCIVEKSKHIDTGYSEYELQYNTNPAFWVQ